MTETLVEVELVFLAKSSDKLIIFDTFTPVQVQIHKGLLQDHY